MKDEIEKLEKEFSTLKADMKGSSDGEKSAAKQEATNKAEAAKKKVKEAEEKLAAAKKKSADSKKEESKKDDKKPAADKKAANKGKVEEIVDHIVSDCVKGSETPTTKLAKKLSETLLSDVKGAPKGKIDDLESAIGLLVVEARDAKHAGKDPKKSTGFKEAADLVLELATSIQEKYAAGGNKKKD